jgi:hypothetical protein
MVRDSDMQICFGRKPPKKTLIEGTKPRHQEQTGINYRQLLIGTPDTGALGFRDSAKSNRFK